MSFISNAHLLANEGGQFMVSPDKPQQVPANVPANFAAYNGARRIDTDVKKAEVLVLSRISAFSGLRRNGVWWTE